MGYNQNNYRGLYQNTDGFSFKSDRLTVLSSAAEQILSTTEIISDKVHEDRERLKWFIGHLSANEVNIGVLGQFNSGKSSFINALLAEQLLPVSIIPLTNVFIYVKAGESRKVQIDFINESPLIIAPENPDIIKNIISEYATEEGNPGNGKSARLVTIYHPSPLLNGGMVLIDTPGISSPMQAVSDSVFNNLYRFDAIFVILSADNLITEDELDFIKKATTYTRHIYFVINKTDHFDGDSLRSALKHTNELLNKAVKREGARTLFAISAINPDNHENNETPPITGTGIEAVKKFIFDQIVNNKSLVLYESGKDRLIKIITDVQSKTISLMSMKYKKLKELNLKAESSERVMTELERNKSALPDILEGDANRAVNDIQLKIESLRADLSSSIKSMLINEYTKNENKHWEQIFNDIRNNIITLISVKWIEISDSTKGMITEIINKHIMEINESLALAGINLEMKLGQDISAMIFKRIRGSSAAKLKITDWQVLIEPIQNNPLHGREKRESLKRERIQMMAHGIVNRNVENMRWILTERINAAMKIATDCIISLIDDTIISMKEANELGSGNTLKLIEEANTELHSLEFIHSRLNELAKYLHEA